MSFYCALILYIQGAGYKTLIRLRKRRFRCQDCGKVAVAETSLVKKNHQIATIVNQKIAQKLMERLSMTDIAERLAVSTSTVIRKLKEFKFKADLNYLPTHMSWEWNSLGRDCFSWLQEGKDELYCAGFWLAQGHHNSGRTNASNHLQPFPSLFQTSPKPSQSHYHGHV